MLTWPWQILYWLGPLAAGGALWFTLSNKVPRHALSRVWAIGLVLTAAGLTASTALSPYRAQVLPWVFWPATTLALAAAGASLLANVDEGLRLEHRLLQLTGSIGGLLALVSLTMWLARLAPHWEVIPHSRNPHPLGHANYTAGTGLLFLPCLIGLAAGARGWRRVGWGLLALACLAMLQSGGSRGATLGLAAMAGLGLLAAWRRLPKVAVVAVALALMSAGLLHPGVRRGLLPPPVDAPVNMSNAQRMTWIEGGWQATLDRPLTGWGTGATPWFFPRYRGGLDYGPYEVLQLHNTPLQLWAEGGLATLLGALLLTGLVMAAAVRTAREATRAADTAQWVALATLTGYGVFSITDWQLDVPVVCAVLGLMLAIMAARCSAKGTGNALARRAGAWGVIGVLVAVCWIGFSQNRLRASLERGDWEHALQLAPHDAALRIYAADRLLHSGEGAPADPAERRKRALGLLQVNIDAELIPELSHTMAGWARLANGEAAAALVDFRSAIAVAPNHGSALRGAALAALSLGRRDEAERCLKRACLADPRFIASGWWRVPAMAAVRDAVLARVDAALVELADDPQVRLSVKREAAYLRALLDWLDGEDKAAERLIANARDAGVAAFWERLTGRGEGQANPAAGLRTVLALQAGHLNEDWSERLRMLYGENLDLTAEQRLVAVHDPVTLVRSALSPLDDAAWPVRHTKAGRAGFQVNHRHPRLQGVWDGGYRADNLWAASLLEAVWPGEFWLPDSRLVTLFLPTPDMIEDSPPTQTP
ncbi:MAG: O-antigen ligase family protein [Verrucomicrobiota bacterium]